MIHRTIDSEMDRFANEKLYPEEWTLDGLITEAEGIYAPKGSLVKSELEAMSRDELKAKLYKTAEDNYNQREKLFGSEIMRDLERLIMLKVVDNKWMEHLDHMDMLREGIGLRSYGQRNPLVEYKIEGHNMFQEMIDNIQDDIVSLMYRVNVVREQPPQPEDRLKNATVNHGESISKSPQAKKNTVGRNDPCPCGSGKKYKNCCGRNK